MSNKSLLFSWFLLAAIPSLAQDCITCSCKIEAAIKSKSQADYKTALLQLTAAASTCGSNRSKDIQDQISDIYRKIDSLKVQAEFNEGEAKKERNNAVVFASKLEISEARARASADSAQIAKNEAINRRIEAEAAKLELEEILEELKLEQTQRLKAEMQQKVFAQAEVLQIKGQNAEKDKQFDQAISCFQTAFNLIDTFSDKNNALLARLDALRENIRKAQESKGIQKAFWDKIKEADSLAALGRTHYSKAFDALFEAHQMDGFKDSALQKLNTLDGLLQQRIKPGKEFIGPAYFEVMTKSFKANRLLQNIDVASSRMTDCMELYPETKLFEDEPEAMDFIKRYRYSFLRRVELFAAFKSYLPQTSPTRVIRVERGQQNQIAYPNLLQQFTIGSFFRATDKFRLGLEFSTNDLSGISLSSKLIRFSNLPTFEFTDQLKVPEKGFYSYPLPKQWDFTFLGAYKLKETVHHRWRTRQFTLEWLVGITRGFGNLGFSNKYVQLFLNNGEAPTNLIESIVESSGIPNASIKLDQASGPALYVLDPNYVQRPGVTTDASYTNFLTCQTLLIQLPFNSQSNRYYYTNGTTGFRFSFIPFPKYRLQIIGDMMYSFSLNKRQNAIKFNLGEEMLRMLENTYQISPADAAQLSEYYLKNCDVDVTIRQSYAQFNTGIGCKLGLGFQF